MTRNQIVIEARAKLFWGESQQAVFTFLQANGLGDNETKEILAKLMKERAAAVREEGSKNILIGAFLLLAPVCVYVVYLITSLLFLKILGLAIFVGCVGLWKVVQGARTIVAPSSESRDLSNLSE